MSPNGRKKQKADQKSVAETIHSGHFMVSDIDDSEIQDGDESPSLVVHESDCDQESSPIPARGFDFESACKETSKTYTFGPRSSLSISIDASLTKLFECMTLAYSGKLTSPRWKQFKGLKLRLKEKIRLNNIIWRAWHMQFVMRQKTFVCQFATPLDGEMHSKPEAVVIEGTYWKRRMANITAEYKKWRLFYKDRVKIKPSSNTESMAIDFDSRWSQRSVDSFPGSIDEDFFMDFTDTLFSTFNPSQPFDFPNPREIAARAGIADFIQPGLVQLQPSVDDFMDTFEPLQGFLNSKLPPLLEESSYNNSSQVSNLSPVMNPEINLYDAVPQSNVFNLSNTSYTPSATKRSADAKRKIFSHQKPQQMRLSQPEKMVMDSFLGMPSESLLSQESEANSLGSDQAALSPQLSCSTNIQSPGKQNEATLLDSEVQPCANLGSFVHPSSPNLLTEPCQQKLDVQNSQIFSASTRRSGILHPATFNFNAKPQVSLFQQTQSAQVPLSSLTEQTLNSAAVSNSSQVKGPAIPLMLNVDLGQNQTAKTVINNINALEGSFQAQNIFSMQLPLLQSMKKESESVDSRFASHKGVSKAKPTAEAQIFRRHSYATGQQVQNSMVQPQLESVINKRSRPIAPATTAPVAVVNFAVPGIPSRHRTRSRSVSSPQGGSPKAFAQQSSQAVSLTDISVTLASQISARRERTLLPDISPFTRDTLSGNVSSANLLSQSTVLAQLLSSGRTVCDLNAGVNKDMNRILPSTTSPVTLIESIPSLVTAASQTFVLAPIPITSVAGVSDFQKNLLVGAANQVFGAQASPCNVPSPLPSNSSSSAGSPLPVAGPSFDAGAAKTVRLKSDEERTQYKEHRRVCHINAEQKRRCNIKNGFEALHQLLPPLSQNPNAKVSKAALLQRGAEYIRTLKAERQQQQEEAEQLKKQIEALNQAISHYQSQLPASGVPVPCQKTNRIKEMFEEYVRQQTLKNWKFWIFSLILEPLVDSYNSSVSTANVDEMCKSILAWLDQHCSLVALRPGVLNSLRHLSTTTNILSDPSCIAEEATRAVTKKETRPQ